MSFWTDGPVEVNFQHLRGRAPFDGDATRRALQARLHAVPGVRIPDDRLEKRPNFNLSALDGGRGVGALLDVLAWVEAVLARPDVP